MKHFRTLIICIFALNIFLKSILISSIPPTLTDDETYYATEAQSILVSGSDLHGTWRPWNLAPANPIYSELTGLTYAPGFLLFPNHTQIAIKVIPILMGSLLPILLAFIIYKLFKQKIFFVSTALLATFNPWVYQFSRMSFDSLASVFFYTLGIVGMLYLRGWKIVLTLIPFSLGFFQYQGHKPLIIPLVLLTLVYLFVTQEKVTKWKKIPSLLFKSYRPALCVLVVTIGLLLLYMIRLPTLSSSVRIDEFLIDTEQISSNVNQARKHSFQNPFLSLFSNKIVEVLSLFLHSFVATFDLTHLFLQGNKGVDTFAVTSFGFLYIVDAVLILMALSTLLSESKWRWQSVFLISVTLLGTIPSVLKSEELWITFRASFMIIGLLLLASVGASFIWQSKNRFFRIGLVAVYSACVISFFYHYFASYPILATKDSSFYNRVVASYIKRQPDVTFSLYADRTVFDSILAHNQLITKDTIKALNRAYSNEKYELNTLKIADGCIDPAWVATQSATVIVDYRIGLCEGAKGPSIATPSAGVSMISIGSITDSLSQYWIYNDHLCTESALPKFVTLNENKFTVESLSDQDFCETFFTIPGGKIDRTEK